MRPRTVQPAYRVKPSARPAPLLATEWHSYKSGKTGKIAGAYLYMPQHTEDNLGHVYQTPGGALWYAHSYVSGCTIEGGPFATMEIAKKETARQISAYIRGVPAKQLVLNLPLD